MKRVEFNRFFTGWNGFRSNRVGLLLTFDRVWFGLGYRGLCYFRVGLRNGSFKIQSGWVGFNMTVGWVGLQVITSGFKTVRALIGRVNPTSSTDWVEN